MKNTRLSSIVQKLLVRQTAHPSVQLAVGELVCDENQLQTEWRELTNQTLLAGVTLKLRIIPAEQQCMWCFLVYHPDTHGTKCPQCHSMGAKILKGEEFFLEED